MSKPDRLTINIDGAARGNPGPAACAFVIRRDQVVLERKAILLGSCTNNVAEYQGLIHALGRALELGAREVRIRSDSELLVKQMQGHYRVKNRRLQELFDQAEHLASGLSQIQFEHVRRSANHEADELCNEVLDGRGQVGGSRAPLRTGDTQATAGSVDEEAVDYLEGLLNRRIPDAELRLAAEMAWGHLRSLLEQARTHRGKRP